MNPVLVLQARAEATARLFAANEFDLEDALAPLLSYARDQVVDLVGADASFAIIQDAFKGLADL
jgi:hypothetical protein